MIAKPILFTLGWRVRTVASVAMWPFVTLVYWFVYGLAATSVSWLVAYATGEWAAREVSRSALHWAAGTWAAGVALGCVVAWTLHELLLCPISALLPRLRKRLTVEVAVALAFIWILVIAYVALVITHRGPLGEKLAACAAIFAVGFCGSGVGLLVASPARFRSPWSAAALVLTLVGSMALLGSEGGRVYEWSAVAAPLLTAVGVVAVARALSRVEHRVLLASAADSAGDRSDPVTLDMAFRDAEYASSGAPSWSGGRSWARATLHELCGARSGGWHAQAAWRIAILMLCVLMGGLVGGSWDDESATGNDPASSRGRSIWTAVANGLLADNPTTWRVVATLWILCVTVWSSSAPCLPRATFVRPIGRDERAHAAWTVCALRVGTVLATTTFLGIVLVAVALWRADAAGDPPLALRGLPDSLGLLAAVAILTPWCDWLRLHTLDLYAGGRRFPNPLRQAAAATLVLGFGLGTGHLLGEAWSAAENAHPVLAPVLFVPAVVASWAVYRSALGRTLRTTTLAT